MLAIIVFQIFLIFFKFDLDMNPNTDTGIILKQETISFFFFFFSFFFFFFQYFLLTVTNITQWQNICQDTCSIHLFPQSITDHIQMKCTISSIYPWITDSPFCWLAHSATQDSWEKNLIQAEPHISCKAWLKPQTHENRWSYLIEGNGEWFCRVGSYLAIAPVNQDYVIALQ